MALLIMSNGQAYFADVHLILIFKKQLIAYDV
jgi:hypothetical protein